MVGNLYGDSVDARGMKPRYFLVYRSGVCKQQLFQAKRGVGGTGKGRVFIYSSISHMTMRARTAGVHREGGAPEAERIYS